MSTATPSAPLPPLPDLLPGNNFMGLQPQLVQRIRAAVAALRPAVHVLTSSELGDVLAERQLVPAVHVIYGGFRVVGTEHRQWRLTHQWHVVAVVRSAAQDSAQAHALMEAGVLGATAMQALVGEKLTGATKPAEMRTPAPARYAKGFQYLPAALEIETLFKKPQP